MKVIKNELIYFATALMFFTRIPVPFAIPYSSEIMNQSQKYFAWVGLLVGLLNALILYGSVQLFNLEIGIVLMMIGSVLLTGAFHEDGFTDMCDSFGGGYGKEKILTIMKDSRVGAYGTIDWDYSSVCFEILHYSGTGNNRFVSGFVHYCFSSYIKPFYFRNYDLYPSVCNRY